MAAYPGYRIPRCTTYVSWQPLETPEKLSTAVTTLTAVTTRPLRSAAGPRLSASARRCPSAALLLSKLRQRGCGRDNPSIRGPG